MGTTNIMNINPLSNQLFFVLPQIFEAGYYTLNLTMINVGKYFKWSFFSAWNKNMILYDFRCTPFIVYLNTNIGSPIGQIISIYGFGWLPTSNFAIYAGLTPCTIVSIQISSLQCKIQQDSYHDIGLYIQSTGIKLTTYSQYSQVLWQVQQEYFANDVTLGGCPQVKSKPK